MVVGGGEVKVINLICWVLLIEVVPTTGPGPVVETSNKKPSSKAFTANIKLTIV
jgi:hypothetical protein